MTDHDLADALRIVLAAAPSEFPQTRALLGPPRPTIVRTGGSIHEPTGPAPRTIPEATVPASVEQRILAALADAPRFGETIDAAFKRKEHALRDAFGSLHPLEARALHKRLVAVKRGDELAAAFSRLAVDRRTRLFGYLEDTRRRQAVVAAKGAA